MAKHLSHLPRLLLAAGLGAAFIACEGGSGSGITGDDGSGLRMAPVTVFDPMVNNNAFTMLVPKGWDYAAEVQWRHPYAIHASAAVTVTDPVYEDRLQIYPIIPFAWAPNSVVPIPTGSLYLGCEVMEPIADPAVFLQRVVLPRLRTDIGDYTVASRTGLTALAQEIYRSNYKSDPNTGISAVRWQIEYSQNGKAYEEAFFCVLSYSTSPALPGNVIWQPEYIYSVRGLKGRLQAREGLLTAVFSSLTVDLKWFALYLQVHDLWSKGQMQAIKDAGELSRYISNVNNEINQTIIDGYNARQASEDRVYREFGESVKGVETYSDPFTQGTVELPSDFSEAWVSSSGEYFLSNAGVDPNVGSTVSWQRLTAAP